MKVRRTRRGSLTKGQEGFTVLETAIAAVVMVIVGLGAAGGFAFAIRYNSAAADRAASMAIAQAAMEKLRAVSFTDSTIAAGTTTTTLADSLGRTYTRVTTITDTVVGGKTTIKKIAIQVTPVNASGPFNTTATGYYGSVMLLTERCTPSPGTNIH